MGRRATVDRPGDRAVMAVDQERIPLVIGLFGMTGEMSLADMRQRKVSEIFAG